MRFFLHSVLFPHKSLTCMHLILHPIRSSIFCRLSSFCRNSCNLTRTSSSSSPSPSSLSSILAPPAMTLTPSSSTSPPSATCIFVTPSTSSVAAAARVSEEPIAETGSSDKSNFVVSRKKIQRKRYFLFLLCCYKEKELQKRRCYFEVPGNEKPRLNDIRKGIAVILYFNQGMSNVGTYAQLYCHVATSLINLIPCSTYPGEG